MQKEFQMNEQLSMKDQTQIPNIGLRGVIQIYRKNKETGEVSFWDESTNTVTLSGYQFILMKMFGLFLDSSHGKYTDNLTRDTNLATPDLNTLMQIGVDPSTKTEDSIATGSVDGYTVMEDDISVNHICQGFMVGNGGAGEDSVTTKNTNYAFVNLRNPIPFQQGTANNPSIAGKYVGAYFGNQSNSISSMYIKKFDSRPKITHSWWVDGQRWDYVNPVSTEALGPKYNATTDNNWVTDRIETYVECKLSISDTDCLSYFNASNETAMINELGLVAFDTVPGQRSIFEKLYNTTILPFLELVYTKNRTDEQMIACCDLAFTLNNLYNDPSISNNTRLKKFFTKINLLHAQLSALCNQHKMGSDKSEEINAKLDEFVTDEDGFSSEASLHVTAYYNQDDTLMYVEDDYLTLLKDESMTDLTLDEAQRIKLVTYYTFNSIPLSPNWEILINYRIYAN